MNEPPGSPGDEAWLDYIDFVDLDDIKSPHLDLAQEVQSEPRPRSEPRPQPSETLDGASTSSSSELDGECWGGILKALNAGKTPPPPSCTAGFVMGRGHLKNKFCPRCTEEGFSIHLSHVRGLTPQLEAAFRNARMQGLWTSAPEVCDIQFRVVNNTSKACGPKLIVFRSPPTSPAHAFWFGPLSAKVGESVEDGRLPMVVSKGTIVPLAELKDDSTRRVKRRQVALIACSEGSEKRAAQSARKSEATESEGKQAPLLQQWYDERSVRARTEPGAPTHVGVAHAVLDPGAPMGASVAFAIPIATHPHVTPPLHIQLPRSVLRPIVIPMLVTSIPSPSLAGAPDAFVDVAATATAAALDGTTAVATATDITKHASANLTRAAQLLVPSRESPPSQLSPPSPPCSPAGRQLRSLNGSQHRFKMHTRMLTAITLIWLVLNPVREFFCDADSCPWYLNAVSPSTPIKRWQRNAALIVLGNLLLVVCYPTESAIDPRGSVLASVIIAMGSFLGACDDFFRYGTIMHVNRACYYTHAVMCLGISLTWLSLSIVAMFPDKSSVCTINPKAKVTWRRLRQTYAIDGAIFIFGDLALYCLGPVPSYPPCSSDLSAGLLRGATTLSLSYALSPAARRRIAAVFSMMDWKGGDLQV